MKRIWLACGVYFMGGIVTVVCSAPPAAKSDALLAADRAFDAATAERKIDGFSSFLADNVATLRADRPVLRGKAALQQDWKPLLENKSMSLRWQPTSAEISKSGDLGYTVGSYTITRADEKGGAILGTGKYLTVWRLQKDGTWKVEFDTGVPDAPPASPKQAQGD
jgi:ketosteroid isomerase-like protein